MIDDDQGIREALQGLLEGEGFLVFAAGNGQEGLAALATMPAPCAILLDVNMPVMNGREFLSALRTEPKLSGLPVIALSATDTPARMPGVQDFLTKPVDVGALLATIRKYCVEERKERA